MTYHLHFRLAALRIYEYMGSMRKAAAALRISAASICRWVARSEQLPRRRRSKITAAMEALVQSKLASVPWTTCSALAAHMFEVFQVRVSRQLVHVIVKRLGLSWKRTRSRGTSKASDDLRKSFVQAAQTLRDGSHVVISVDESGFDQRCRPVYGFAPKGVPVICRAPSNPDRRRLSLLMAVDSEGRTQQVIQPSAVKGTKFAEFVENLQSPRGSVILLDNASIHKTEAVRLAAARRGFVLLYLPPYSPEFNPIEMVFGIIKSEFYKRRYTPAGTNLEKSVRDCITEKSTPETIRNCFRHVFDLIDKEA